MALTNEELIVKIGANIKAIREAKGIAQHDLAYKANLITSIVCNIENGKTLGTKLITFNSIAGALGVKLGELLK